MSEEEIIEKINWAIYVNEMTKSINGDNTHVNVNDLKGLLDLYNKEREKNKNSVSKDRINRKIEELKDNCYAESIEFNNELIEILQELLEE